MGGSRFEVFRSAGNPTGRFAWHFKDANGHITFTGGESFARRDEAHRSICDVVADVLTQVMVPATERGTIDKDDLTIVDLDENGDVLVSLADIPEAKSHEYPPEGS